jgi:hypothetical protein
LRIVIHAEGHTLPLDVPDHVITEGMDFFSKLDKEMDQGWQISDRWVENPSTEERCQIAAEKLLTAMHVGSAELGLMLAGYILARMPDVTEVRINDSDSNATEFIKANRDATK